MNDKSVIRIICGRCDKCGILTGELYKYRNINLCDECLLNTSSKTYYCEKCHGMTDTQYVLWDKQECRSYNVCDECMLKYTPKENFTGVDTDERTYTADT